jgi:thioredoxin 1
MKCKKNSIKYICKGDVYMSKQITSSEFKKEVLESKEPVLVDFYADWCGPCKMLGPIMDEISKEHKVFKINTDEEQDLAMEYGIMSIPCVIAFKDGKEVNRSVGLADKDTIVNLIK